MTKAQLTERIKRDLGWPLVKVELTEDQIDDAIDDSVFEYVRWATSNANEEVFFTISLSAGQSLYDLPEGVITVLDYDDSGGSSTGGVNTLFTVESFLYTMGYYPDLGRNYGNLVSYHMALDFLKNLDRYVTNKYVYRYFERTNQLQLIPIPDEQQYVLIRAFMKKGSALGSWTEEDFNEDLYSESWVRRYSLTLSKEKLGYIRRKFSNFQSLGGSSIQLDGDQLIQEAREEKERLLEELKNDQSWEGMDILIG